MSDAMLDVKNLNVQVEDNTIINGFDLSINPGEVHAIMGPNGSGKSTLSAALAGHPDYQVQADRLILGDQNLLDLSVNERLSAGLFLGFQYPTEIAGVNNLYFMRSSFNSLRRARGEEEMDAYDFMAHVRSVMKTIGMDESFLRRGLNEGFSGGEKKRNEVLQMLLLQPKLAILDEMDSGLDIDALQDVACGVNSLRSPDRSFLLITHYKRLLEHVKPDVVHVMVAGKIVKSGGLDLADTLEEKGYGWAHEMAGEL